MKIIFKIYVHVISPYVWANQRNTQNILLLKLNQQAPGPPMFFVNFFRQEYGQKTVDITVQG